jgi:RNA recognition motif-containing protein
MPSMKLYVGGFSYSTTEAQLNDMFKEFGKIVSINIITDRDTGNSKGFGFVEMSELKEGQEAIKALNGKESHGRSLVVNQARPQGSRPPSYGGGFRR